MLKILLIDDDAFTRLMLRKMLKSQDYTILEAETGEEGLRLANYHRPALIICDWQMPGMNGLEVCRQVKASPDLSTTIFILVTSRNAVEDLVEGLDSGADEFLSKPVQGTELKARIKAGLRLHQSLQKLQQLTLDLTQQQHTLQTELSEAADYVRALLPKPISGKVAIESCFLPSRQLGGDCFDYYWIDENHLAMYVLDVSGHGLGAALPSISIKNWLQSRTDLRQPDAVLKSLNTVFEMSKHNNQYFTIWYGVYSMQDHYLVYSSAGHPPAILISGETNSAVRVQRLTTRGMPIGMLPDTTYSSQACEVRSLSTLYLFSDGIYEIRQPNGNMWKLDDLIEVLFRQYEFSHANSLDQIIQTIRMMNQIQRFEDDCSLLQIRFN